MTPLRRIGLLLALALPLSLVLLPRGTFGDSRASDDASTVRVKVDPAPYRVAAPKRPTKPRHAAATHLLIVSIDGLAYPTLQRFLPRLPTLRGLAQRGFRRPMTTVFPSMTWASHVSAMTGQYPRVHGILGNRWYQSGKGLVRPYAGQTSDKDRQVRTPSLYDLVHAQGWTTAAINWSATQYADTVTYNLPESMYSKVLPGRLLSPSLIPLLRDLRPTRRFTGKRRRGRRLGKRWRKRLGEIMKREDLSSDRLSTDIALRLLRLPKAKLPRLMMLHYVAADSVQHVRGMRSPKLFTTVRALDRMLAEVLRGYRRAGIPEQRLAVLAMSDHGFSEVHRTMDLRLLLRKEGISRYRSGYTKKRVEAERVLSVFNGHAAFVYVKNGDEKVTALIARLVRGRAYRRCIKAVYGPAQYAALGLPRPLDLAPEGKKDDLHGADHFHPGAPSLIVLSRPDCSFYNGHRTKILRKTRWRFGIHGYLPTLRSIQAFLIGAGAGFEAGGRELAGARIVDVAPTSAMLLGLRWPKAWPGTKEAFRLDGRALSEVLAAKPKPSKKAPANKPSS